MAEKRKYNFNKFTKVNEGLPTKAMQLPQFINSEEINNIISRGCKSTNNIKRFKHIESYTPSPSHESRYRPDRISETPYRITDFSNKNNESISKQNFDNKILALKQKNNFLKESIKEIESKYKAQILVLKRENEKLIQNSKFMKKEHNETKIKTDEIIFQLENESKSYKKSFESFIKNTSKLIESISPYYSSLKEDFNKILNPYVSILSAEISTCLFTEKSELLTTGQFKGSSGFSDSVHSVNAATKEAIVMKNYTPQVHGELELRLGDRITVLKGDENFLWLGKVNDRIGLFPSSHVMLD